MTDNTMGKAKMIGGIGNQKMVEPHRPMTHDRPTKHDKDGLQLVHRLKQRAPMKKGWQKSTKIGGGYDRNPSSGVSNYSGE